MNLNFHTVINMVNNVGWMSRRIGTNFIDVCDDRTHPAKKVQGLYQSSI